MATLTIKDPFVTWKFKCNNANEVKKTKAMAKSSLSSYLQGYARAIRTENPLYPKFSFQLVKEEFVRTAGSRNDFVYKVTLKRKSTTGAAFPQPDSTVDPKGPKKPNP